MRKTIASGAAVAAAALLVSSIAGAAPAGADLLLVLRIGRSNSTEGERVDNGGTARVSSLAFKVGFTVDNLGPDPTTVRVRFELPTGLRWTPSPTFEGCTLTGSVADCRSPRPLAPDDATRRSIRGVWNVEAERPGSYVLKGEIAESSASDPDPSNNRPSSVTAVVAAEVTASAAKLRPAAARAGAPVSATVRVSAGGVPVRPTGLTCAGSVGRAKLAGVPRVATGSATCVYRPPRSARGKLFRATIAFTAAGAKIIRRVEARLR